VSALLCWQLHDLQKEDLMNRALVLSLLVVVMSMIAIPAPAQAPNRAAVEKQIITDERAINDALAKGDLRAFRANIAPDAVSIDPAGVTRANSPDFDKMIQALRIQNWNIDGSQFYWVNDTTVVHIYRWTGTGTFQGQPLSSPTWASTVWANRQGRWTAVFHQETNAMPAGPASTGGAGPASTTRP
jgi:hypothetical protein